MEISYWSSSTHAARAAPYEKGTETPNVFRERLLAHKPRARPPMRRGLKLRGVLRHGYLLRSAARAAPYEKGTETALRATIYVEQTGAARAAPYEKGTETLPGRRGAARARCRARGPL